jgi:hypothetical protein
MIPRDASDEPSKMLAIETVSMRALAAAIRIEVRDWLSRPEVECQILSDVSSRAAIGVE